MYVFTITFAWFVQAVAYFNSFRNRAKNSTIQIKARYDDSNLLAKLPRHSMVCENWLKLRGGDDAPSKTCLRLPIGETFSREVNGTRGAFMPRQQVVFITDF